MATKSDLRTRLKRRLGLGVVSEVEKERLGEALNSGLARAVSDGIPGLAHDTYTASVAGEATMTSATIAEFGATATLVGLNPLTAKVFPHDILNVDVAGTVTRFLIQDTRDADEVNLGANATAAFAGGDASTITRRALLLPTAGQVVAIHPVSGGRSGPLTYRPLSAHRDPFETGTPHYFEQRFSSGQNTSFVSLWPAPTDITKQWTVVQLREVASLDADADTLDFPGGALDAILELARLAYLTWTGTSSAQTAMLALEAKRDTADSLKNSSTSRQIYTKI